MTRQRPRPERAGADPASLLFRPRPCGAWRGERRSQGRPLARPPRPQPCPSACPVSPFESLSSPGLPPVTTPPTGTPAPGATCRTHVPVIPRHPARQCLSTPARVPPVPSDPACALRPSRAGGSALPDSGVLLLEFSLPLKACPCQTLPRHGRFSVTVSPKLPSSSCVLREPPGNPGERLGLSGSHLAFCRSSACLCVSAFFTLIVCD